jgi:predicted DNA-binding protein (UPF0251 family)
MGRNKKKRWISSPPPASIFKPAGIPARELERVVLRLDEYEALRLADYEGLKQAEVASELNVSRPTVSRILESARRTVATAMVEGKTLVIEGGPVQQRPAGGRGRGGRRRRRGHGGPPVK